MLPNFRELQPGTYRNRVVTLILWMIFYASFTLFSPPLLDDADSVHAEVAHEMLLRHDWVTLYANGIRYLEKAPLLYWSMATSMRVFGVSAAAARLPLALSVLALALGLESFGRRAFDSSRAGLYAALITLSSFGIFIFTRITIPDAVVCLWITLAIYAYWRNSRRLRSSRLLCCLFAAACALNVLTKGLIGIVFPIAIVLLHRIAVEGPGKALTSLGRLYPLSSAGIFFGIAAPWHILAGLRNPTQGHPAPISSSHVAGGGLWHRHWVVPLPTDGNVHGWTWFYFINEHVLRYLNLRVPRDYDTVPLLLFYGLLLVWLMPWSAFLAHALATVPLRRLWGLGRASFRLRSHGGGEGPASRARPPSLRSDGLTALENTRLLLGIWAGTVLLFFSFSTRQEYYVLPALPALILLLAGWLDEEADEAATYAVPSPRLRSGQRISLALLIVGSVAALAAAFFAITSRSPNANVDLALLLKQNPSDYALSFGHLLDLNRRALGAFRVPLVLTAIALFTSTFLSWRLRREFRPHAGSVALAAGAFVFLLAAHQGLRIFSPVLTSWQLARAIEPQLRPPGSRFPELIVINGEYESASTLGFYLHRPVYLESGAGHRVDPASALHILNGRSSNLWYGSFFPDAPPIFEDDLSIQLLWSGERRVFLWTEPEHVPKLPGRSYVIAESGGKEILSNQPNPF